MGHVSIDRVRDVARSAFWLVPALCVMAAIGLAIGLLSLDAQLGATRAAFLFPGPPAAARSFLSSIIQAMITFTGLVFSITIVVLQLTSGQFSPRVLRAFLRDRTIKFSLGAFLATFVYAMFVLRGVHDTGGHNVPVPRVAVTVTFALVLLSVGMFIRYISHVANMIRVASIIDGIGKDSRRCLEHIHPADGPIPRDALRLGATQRTVAAYEPGVIVSVHVAGIVREACGADCQVVLVPRIGDYVPAGAALLHIYGDEWIKDRRLVDRVSFDTERTLEQDLAFGFRQLVDIAQRALSPGINDPTTAVQSLDVLHDLLRRLVTRHLGPGHYADRTGVVRLVVPRLSFAGYLGLAVGQIWHYGADAVQVPKRLLEMLTDLAQVALPEHRAEIDRWLQIVRPAGVQDPTWNTTATAVEVAGEAG